MGMSRKRREEILAALAAGHHVLRYWHAANGRGYLRHSLKGVSHLRESECDLLRKEGLLRFETQEEKATRGACLGYGALVYTGGKTV